MTDKQMVEVVYGGVIETAINRSLGHRGMIGPTVDFRFQPFADQNSDLNKMVERVPVLVDKWLISYLFRSKIANGLLREVGWHSDVDVNTYLTVLSHFGFDADYAPVFIRKVEPMIAEIMLQAYRVNEQDRISAREFGGATYIRGEFFRKFDDLLVKYGM